MQEGERCCRGSRKKENEAGVEGGSFLLVEDARAKIVHDPSRSFPQTKVVHQKTFSASSSLAHTHTRTIIPLSSPPYSRQHKDAHNCRCLRRAPTMAGVCRAFVVAEKTLANWPSNDTRSLQGSEPLLRLLLHLSLALVCGDVYSGAREIVRMFAGGVHL